MFVLGGGGEKQPELLHLSGKMLGCGLVWASNLKPSSHCHGSITLTTEIKEWLRISQIMVKITQAGFIIPDYFVSSDLLC